MRTITLEEHFVSPAFLEGPGKGIKEQANNPEHPMAGGLKFEPPRRRDAENNC